MTLKTLQDSNLAACKLPNPSIYHHWQSQDHHFNHRNFLQHRAPANPFHISQSSGAESWKVNPEVDFDSRDGMVGGPVKAGQGGKRGRRKGERRAGKSMKKLLVSFRAAKRASRADFDLPLGSKIDGKKPSEPSSPAHC